MGNNQSVRAAAPARSVQTAPTAVANSGALSQLLAETLGGIADIESVVSNILDKIGVPEGPVGDGNTGSSVLAQAETLRVRVSAIFANLVTLSSAL